MPEALTNFPNGISTSVVMLTEEAEFYSSTAEGRLDTSAVTLTNTIDVTEGLGTYYTGLKATTHIEGVAGNATFNDIIGFNFTMDGTNLSGDKVGGTGLLVKPQNISGKFYYLNALAITNVVLGTLTATASSAMLSIGALSANSSGAANLSLKTIDMWIPAGNQTAGGTVNNYGIRITGNGHASATNWGVYVDSTATNYFGGPIIQKPAVSTVPVNNGELTVSATSNTQVTVRLKGSDAVVRSVVLTLA